MQLGYGGQPIVKGVSLTPPPAQLTVLAGPNGCGKSTLLRGLARLLKPSQGQVILNGADIASRPARAVAKELGPLPQGPQAPAGLTVRELVARGRYPHRSLLRSWSREDEQALTQALADTHTTELAHRQVDSLSGGQRQRVWIAMVLAQRTGVLLLDEPTTYLDLTHQIEVLDLLRELNRRHQTTIVVVLHELALAARYADYLVLATDGPTVARLIGPHVSTALPALEPGPEVALVTLVVDAPALDKHPRGTGLLVSEEATAVRAKALTHATAKWQWVADAAGPGRHVVRLSYGRGGEDARFSEVALADEQLITLALRDATRMMDVALTHNNLVDADVVRWRGVLPASTPGHRDRVKEFRERASELGTLSTVGSWAAGSGLVLTVKDTYEQIDRLIYHAAQDWEGVTSPKVATAK